MNNLVSVSLRQANNATLNQAIIAQRSSTLDALVPLSGERWLGPILPIVNPPLWEIGHVGWFHERWCLREHPDSAPTDSILPDADKLYDSTPIVHHTRWGLPLVQPEPVRAYLLEVLDASLERLAKLAEDDPKVYFHRLSLFHEMMHREAFCYSWHTHGYEAPTDLASPAEMPVRRWLKIPAGQVVLGSPKSASFVFDNEKWANPVALDSFEISNRVISNGEYAEFVRDGGYQNPIFWPAEAWTAMQKSGRHLPTYWRFESDRIQIRHFNHWDALEPGLPMTHVTIGEAQAWCRWAGMTLPTEAQWLKAAANPAFEWGAVWEWTASAFGPLPGFSADPYKEYSEPWFNTHRVLKGASLATPDGMRDARFRNFYQPDRADVFNGFRVIRTFH